MAISRRIDNGGSMESRQIASRLLGSLPAATFELETFARLAGVVASRKVPTAAMECVHRPRLLINPDFVAQHCKRDEHLFLLVMHELWHVLLAHTSLYPRVTKAQNIAFDAIINAQLVRQFRAPEYMGFFDALNPPDTFPHLLLRPPVGWPYNPVYPDDPPGTARILRQLYPPQGVPQGPMPFYREILDLIKRWALENGGLVWVVDGPVLLGDHTSPDQDLFSNTFLSDVMERVIEKWPVTPFGGRGRGGNAADWRTPLVDPGSEAARRAFAQVLRLALGQTRSAYRRKRSNVPGVSGTSVLPNGRDRLMPARRMLGASDVLWSQPGNVRARVQERERRSHVYLDVSGSMSSVIPHLLALLLPYVADGSAEVFQFSTLVEPLRFRQLQQGLVRTTGGTDIACVMDHLLNLTRPAERVLIVTDGYTGSPSDEEIARLRRNRTRVHVVLPAESPYRVDLETVAASFTVLPPITLDGGLDDND